MNATEFKGYWGEFLATALLKIKGYSIIAHRYKTACGEIDIIAKKRDVIVFVEVKARKSEEKCFVAITPKQLERVQRASEIFMRSHSQYFGKFSRFDVILVSDWSIPVHIENISI